MKYSIGKTVLLSLGLLCSGASIAETPQSGGTLNAVVQPEPPGLMLGILQNGPTQNVAGQIYEGLLRYDENLDAMPSLAKEWSISDDGLTYTFHLEEGVKWHDGEPFTSADVVFSIDVFLPETNTRLRNNMQRLESITAPDDNTVVFKLSAPFGPFLGVFEAGSAPIIPKHIYEGTDFKNNPANNTPIGTGPFKFDKWEKGSYIHLVKNEEYYLEGKPYLDDIYYHIIPDAASRSIAYETGKVDLLPGGSIENFDVERLLAMDNTCSSDKGWEFFGPLSWLWMNNASGPLADVRIRQAVSLAIDREFALNALWNGVGKVASGPVSSSTRFYDSNLPELAYDPDKARQLLKDAGYDGETLRLLPLPYGETWQRWAEAVKQNLSEVGINVELIATDAGGWNQKLAERDYDLAFTYLYQYGDPDLGVSRTYISTNAEPGSPWNNVSGYINEEVDALFAEASAAGDAEQRQELYSKVQAKLVEEAPVAWLLELSFPTIYRCSVQNPINTATGVNDGMRDAWIKQ
ncbi:ABC transporter substrate-binding protein [Granulosicoccus antarcticus]|uniref:ABC transporter substrate-binding protein n=1 Tax=Granulosicoccus antarcticus TaxID=437505 RepID=UPI00197AB764|nr:ABC transporter substrate-binding protein [Granulosicoccus antarcticus]